VTDSRPVVIWDVDDVLNDLMRVWLEDWWHMQHPNAPAFDAISANPPHHVLGISATEYFGSLDAFRAARFRSLTPRADVVAWFERHGRRARHIALTAVPREFAELSAAWVMAHFGDWIQTFAFVPAARTSDDPPARRLKAEYIEWLGRGDVFVDDKQENVEYAQALGLRGIVAPRPWNDASQRSFAATLDEIASRL
jgi:hypothetical protein